MDVTQFWNIVESTRAASGASHDNHVQLLAEHLSALSPDEVISFQQIFDHLTDQAYTWPLWAAAYIIGGGCSDDGFIDFRSWLISMGRDTYTRALSDPESLADVDLGPDGEEDAFFEEFAYVPRSVYQAKTGQPLRHARTAPSKPTGEEWEEDDLASRFPRLSSRYQFD